MLVKGIKSFIFKDNCYIQKLLNIKEEMLLIGNLK